MKTLPKTKSPMKHSLFVIAALMLLMACKPSVPSDVNQPDDMEDILYDFHIAQAMAKEEGPGTDADFKKTEYFLAVLKKHGVTQEDFDSSMVYYYSYLPRLKKIYTNVNERLSDEAKTLGAVVAI